MSIFRKWLFLLLLLPSALPIGAQVVSDTFDTDRISRATVYIMQTRSPVDDTILCIGTGTLVSRDGLILTNAHNTVTNNTCTGTEIIISMTLRVDEPPVAFYRANVVQSDEGLDIALIRVTRTLDGRLLESDTLALPFVELADSSAVELDESLTVFGYPDIYGSPVELRQGVANGFTTEPSAPDRAWIKVETRGDNTGIPGAMTGGGVYNRDGELVGIPTTVPVTSIIEGASCVRLQDTNGDDLVNRTDVCVPVGGFINAIRPSNFARPLIRAATLGLTIEKISSRSAVSTISGAPSFDRLFFATAVSEGMPTRVVDSLPANPRSLFLFFDYENMTPETVYELRVTVDGRPNATYSLAPVRWSGGERGLWYIGSSDQVWINGIYEFTLYINGLASGSRQITIGGAPVEEPSFSNVFFGISDGGGFFGTVYVLPTGNIVTARFNFQNMTPDTPWAALWYINDEELVGARVEEDSWQDGESGSRQIPIIFEGGLTPGRYRLELYIAGVLSATADFTVAGAAEGAFPRVFTNPRMVTATSPEQAIESVDLSNFPSTVREIYALFDWEQIAPGTLWTLRWLVDGETFFEETVPWSSVENGQNFAMILRGEDGIPDGAYRFEVLINTVELTSDEMTIGIGQLPIDQFAEADGVQLRGRIINAETQQGISGVTFVLISEDFSVIDFIWDSEQIYALATTDRQGRFQLDRPLQFGSPYSVVIAADGYLPISADGVTVDEDTPNPLDIEIPLTQD